MGMTEQRQAERFEVELSAEVTNGEAVISAQTRNLSNTGICLDLNKSLDEGSTIAVTLFLIEDGIEDPDVEPLNLQAGVIWCGERDDEGFSAGCRFDDLSGPVNDQIKLFLSELGEEG
jgi:hypothetical protein